jgi:hypothetical protein
MVRGWFGISVIGDRTVIEKQFFLTMPEGKKEPKNLPLPQWIS